MIKYIGSKRLLLPFILEIIRSVSHALRPAPGTAGPAVLDLFSGTSRVGHAVKKHLHYRVLANDHNKYAHALATCYVQSDRDDVLSDATRLIDEFNRLPGRPGYFTDMFCHQSRYVHPRNGERIDAIREAIADKSLPGELEAVLLVSLMEAADRVDSTTGVQMAYLKDWAPRANNDLALRMPDVVPHVSAGKCVATCLDALDAAAAHPCDVAYLDPPYNQHSYLGNYHVWESLIVWDKPETYGVARKRMDCKERRSAFNSRNGILTAMKQVLNAVTARAIVVSFNNEGYIARSEMESLLAEHGSVHVLERPYKRYVGAQIGIYSPEGEKVGRVSHLKNKEFLYVVVPPEVDWSPGRVTRAQSTQSGTAESTSRTIRSASQ